MTDTTTNADTQLADKLVRTYVRIRDKRAELSQEFKDQDSKLEAQLEKVKTALLEHCKATGIEGARTPHGTFTRTIKKRYWTSDWDAMRTFILEHGAVELLDKRINQTNMAVFLEENPDVLPAGLNVDSEYQISVRRPTK
jgi:hypothetical protein